MSNSQPKAGIHQMETLTWREQEILSLLAKRRTNKEIAQNLGIELATVKWSIAGTRPWPKPKNMDCWSNSKQLPQRQQALEKPIYPSNSPPLLGASET